MKILIVEDEYITRSFLSSIIDWENYGMKLASVVKDGLSALDIIKKERIDIVITDLKMPKMDGNTLIKELKSLEFKGKIIVLSNYDDFNLVKDAMKNGAFEYLLKVTISKDELLMTLNKAIDELNNEKNVIYRNNLSKIYDEKIVVHGYIQEYFKGNKEYKISEYLKSKYLTNYQFIYLRAEESSVENANKENKLSGFIYNIISNFGNSMNIDFISLVNIHRNEFGIVIKSKSTNEDISVLISNLSRDINQYLNIRIKEITTKEYKNIEECLNDLENKYRNQNNILNNKLEFCRPEIKSIVDYIDNNLSKKISLDILSKVVNMNESYLSRIFKDSVGMTISDYIKIKRLEYAKELLKQNDMRIKDVAISIGIQDQLYFSRLFTKYFNITPSEYRDNYSKV